jgi:hypothetical protein
VGRAVEQEAGGYLELLRRAADLLATALDNSGYRRPQDADWADTTPATLRGREGEQAQVRIWVHNTGVLAEADVRLRMTALTSQSGRCVAAEAGAFSPGRIHVPPSASASSLLLVGLEPALPADVYVGYVLAEGLPEAVLPVCAVVAS